MDSVDAFVLIVNMIGWTTAILITRQAFYWRKKHDDAIDSWTMESKNKDKIILDLQDKLKFYEDNQRIIKFEKVIMEPREYCCKFPVHERFIDDKEIFKKVCLCEVSRYMAEALEKDRQSYKLFFERNAFDMTNTVKIKFRLLPYPEETMDFDKILKGEQKDGDTNG